MASLKEKPGQCPRCQALHKLTNQSISYLSPLFTCSCPRQLFNPDAAILQQSGLTVHVADAELSPWHASQPRRILRGTGRCLCHATFSQYR